ncbi:MFS transporter [Streptomyces nogalater]
MPATLNGLFQEDLRPVGSQLTWISDAFLLPVTVLELTFGVLGDLFGRKRLLVGGSVLVAVGEAVSAVSDGVHLLWAGQVVSGLGAAALFPTSLAMIAAGTHSHRDRARGITVWAAALSTGGFVAPVIGGVTGSHGSWRTALVVVVVIAVAGTVVSLLGAEDSRAPEGRSLDLGGQLTVGIGLFALLYAVIQGPTDGWGSTPVVVAFVVAAVFVVLFVIAERRARSRCCAWTCSPTGRSRSPRSSRSSACSASWAPPTPPASGWDPCSTRVHCVPPWPSCCSTV